MLTLPGGSGNALTIYNSGFSLNQVPFWSGSSSSVTSAASNTPTQLTSTSSAAAGTTGGHTNTVGIVVGVIVGIVALSALAGGGFFFLRRKQQRDMEEFKRENDVKTFISGSSDTSRPTMWAPDSRLDTSVGRRMSNGSIADNEDFSRRVLQVSLPGSC
jgi:cell wall integrity and stress response component